MVLVYVRGNYEVKSICTGLCLCDFAPLSTEERNNEASTFELELSQVHGHTLVT